MTSPTRTKGPGSTLEDHPRLALLAGVDIALDLAFGIAGVGQCFFESCVCPLVHRPGLHGDRPTSPRGRDSSSAAASTGRPSIRTWKPATVVPHRSGTGREPRFRLHRQDLGPRHRGVGEALPLVEGLRARLRSASRVALLTFCLNRPPTAPVLTATASTSSLARMLSLPGNSTAEILRFSFGLDLKVQHLTVGVRLERRRYLGEEEPGSLKLFLDFFGEGVGLSGVHIAAGRVREGFFRRLWPAPAAPPFPACIGARFRPGRRD